MSVNVCSCPSVSIQKVEDRGSRRGHIEGHIDSLCGTLFTSKSAHQYLFKINPDKKGTS